VDTPSPYGQEAFQTYFGSLEFVFDPKAEVSSLLDATNAEAANEANTPGNTVAADAALAKEKKTK
jgi:hypothetical protein